MFAWFENVHDAIIYFTQRYKKINIAMHILLTFRKLTNK